MRKLKKEIEELKGTYFLLFFALGAMEKKICGDSSFLRKTMDFLRDKYSLRKIQREIPLQLDTAWPNLLRIAKKKNSTPLSFDVVSTYILDEHNAFAMPQCHVITGVVEKIGKKKMGIKAAKNLFSVKFSLPYHGNIRKGDCVIFHHNWLIGKA